MLLCYSGCLSARTVLVCEGCAVVMAMSWLWAEWRCEDGDFVIAVMSVRVILEQLLALITQTLSVHLLQTVPNKTEHITISAAVVRA